MKTEKFIFFIYLLKHNNRNKVNLEINTRSFFKKVECFRYNHTHTQNHNFKKLCNVIVCHFSLF